MRRLSLLIAFLPLLCAPARAEWVRIYAPTELYADEAAGATVRVYAIGGLAAGSIAEMMQDNLSSLTQTRIMIFQGGVNDVLIWGATMPFTRFCTRSALEQARDHARSVGATLYLQELQPVYTAYLDEETTSPLYPTGPKFDLQRQGMRDDARELGLSLIPTFEALQAHFHGGADAWCLNLANSGRRDGIHLTAPGARALAGLWWAGIRTEVWSALRSRNRVEIAIFGDSITNCGYLQPSEKPGRILFELLRDNPPPLAARDWARYE